MGNTVLTEEEKIFCELYINGDAPFSGNASRCYTEVFNDRIRPRQKALALLERKDIKEYIETLDKISEEDAKCIKRFLTQNLMKIAAECTEASLYDKKGNEISPAAMRSVAVNAMKALMEIHKVKEAQVNKLSIDGGGEGGITFNVIMPEQAKKALDNE